MSRELGRRRFLRAGASASAAAVAAAGASSAAAQSGPDYGGWFEGVSNYDGTTEDMTGQSEVTVEVGASGNGGNYAFSPPAIRVDSGTTVVWEWTGKGGGHNVVEEGGDYESEITASAGTTYSVTFESEGISKYFCAPHRAMGMKGAVAVGGAQGDAKGVPAGDGGGSGGGSTASTSGGSNASTDGASGGAGGSEGGGGSVPLLLYAIPFFLALLSPLVFAVLIALLGRDEEEPDPIVRIGGGG